MLTATGILRYGPTSASVGRESWWVILHCDKDWYDLYSPWMVRHAPARWAKVIDPARVFQGQNVDRTPRLALVRPKYLIPAWGPHISIFRRERPRVNEDIWLTQRKIGDAQWALDRMQTRQDEIKKDLTEARNAVRGLTGGHRQTYEDQIVSLEGQLRRIKGGIKKNSVELDKLLRKQGTPPPFPSGMEVEFQFTQEPKTRSGSHHWWLDVTSEALTEIREFYGLRPNPKVSFHLTLGIQEGKE